MQWRPYRHGIAHHNMRVVRGDRYKTKEYARDAKGRVRKFSSWESAQKAADELNKADGVYLDKLTAKRKKQDDPLRTP